MNDKTDEMVGRVKEAAGVLLNDDKLRKDGKTEQSAGKVKQAVARVVDKIVVAVKE